MISQLNTSRISGLTKRLHRIKLLRRIAKRLARNLVLTQDFHGGRIAFNAVSHSWAWAGSQTYESFDRPLQDRLLALSQSRPRLLDVGANIGVMTLNILLRNPAARAVAVEPGEEAASLLRRSLALNRLAHRCEVLCCAASDGADKLSFDSSGSVMGHVVSHGQEVPAMAISDLMNRVATSNPFLGKMDVEGYETALIPALAKVEAPQGSCFVIELHPFGFNGAGDPLGCLSHLGERFSLCEMGGAPLGTIDPTNFTQIEVYWR